MHYGKLKRSYLEGNYATFYSKIEEQAGLGNYESRMAWHAEHARTHTLKTQDTDSSWFWKEIKELESIIILWKE